VIAQGDNVIAIPGTHNLHHLEENIGANDLVLDAEVAVQLDALINQQTVHGARYNDRAQASVTTERFSAEHQQ
jgi:aryl-alcohol dehydrogenase-like predicted oxidoreductase